MREMLLQRISNDTEAEMPFAGGSGFGSPTLRISIDTKKLARIAKTVAKALQDHFQGSKSDSPSGYISENYNPIALDSDSNFNVDELDDVNFRSMSSAQQDSYECANVLKKRRKKMRKHKYKKRLKANRYKNKK